MDRKDYLFPFITKFPFCRFGYNFSTKTAIFGFHPTFFSRHICLFNQKSRSMRSALYHLKIQKILFWKGKKKADWYLQKKQAYVRNVASQNGQLPTRILLAKIVSKFRFKQSPLIVHIAAIEGVLCCLIGPNWEWTFLKNPKNAWFFISKLTKSCL